MTPGVTLAGDDDIIRVFESLKQSLVMERKTIAEDMFVIVFLPFFLDLPGADPRVTMNTWYGISGGAFNEVTVVGRNGEALYDVPPVMSNRIVAPIGREGGRALSSLLSIAARKDRIIPGTGSALLIDSLKRFNFVTSESDDISLKHKNRWAEIIERYYKPEATPQAQAEQRNDGLDIFVF